jgi:hypothetical protein
MMTQQQLDRAVARSTGESLHTVRRLGFSPLPDDILAEDEGDLALFVDCPFCGRRAGLESSGSALPALAECGRCDIYFDYTPAEVYAAAARQPAAIAAA